MLYAVNGFKSMMSITSHQKLELKLCFFKEQLVMGNQTNKDLINFLH